MGTIIDNTPPDIRSNGGVVPTLRDQFAMAALPGLVAVWQDVEGDNETAVATKAYEIADAMLVVRLR